MHCIRQGRVGGGESHVIDLVRHLDPNKFESIVLAFTDGEMIQTLKSIGITAVVIPTTKPFDVTVWGKVKKLIEQHNIDLIHMHGTRAFSNVCYAARRLKKPIVYTVHGWSFNEFQPYLRKNIAILTEGLFSRMANATINVSFANQLLGKKVINGFQSIVIPNGIDTSKFAVTETFDADIRKKFNIASSTILIGFIARITEQKDPFTLLHAFSLLQKTTPGKFSLLYVGDGELKNELISKTAALGLTDVVHFENFRKDIPTVLSQIEIFCLPSLWEGLSLGLLEAMSMRSAIIATNVDGTKEVIHHNENGLLFTPKDHQALADLITQVAMNRELRDRIKVNARETVITNYSLESMVRKTESVYKNIIAK